MKPHRIVSALLVSILLLCCADPDSPSLHTIQVSHSLTDPYVYYVRDSFPSGTVVMDSVLSDDPTLTIDRVKWMVSHPYCKDTIQGFSYMYDLEHSIIRFEKDHSDDD